MLDLLVRSAEKSIAEGYYEVRSMRFVHRSLQEALKNPRHIPIITEIKFASPSTGTIREDGDVKSIAECMERGGASAISVLTEPKHFRGSLGYLTEAKESVKLPILMKDIIIDPVQIEAGRAAGADAVLLISTIFASRYSKRELRKLIDYAHSLGLEVVLEAHSPGEFREALSSKSDIIGINNRDLESLRLSIETSVSLLRRHKRSKTVICESGLTSSREVRELRSFGADGFLIGTAIMKSGDIESAVRSFTGAWEELPGSRYAG